VWRARPHVRRFRRWPMKGLRCTSCKACRALLPTTRSKEAADRAMARRGMRWAAKRADCICIYVYVFN
jgi:hypothetical protein